jgi:hypothetical protein
MELVRGSPITEYCDKHQLTPRQRLELFVQVCQAVQHAHGKGIIHRDLKPNNVLLGRDGTARIADFGISKAAGAWTPGVADGNAVAADGEATISHHLVGTVHYMAPEQAIGERVDYRADVWSFGATLFTLLAGRRVFEGLSTTEVLEHLVDLDRPAPRLAEVAPGLPRALVELVDRCLAKHAALRPARSDELVAALTAIAAESLAADAPPRNGRRRGLAIAAALIAVVAAVAIVLAVRARPGGGARGPALDPGGPRRVDALRSELARRDLAREPGADALLDGFLADERDARALALGWILRGDRGRRAAAPDLAATASSYATAYARAPDADTQRLALSRLAAVDHARWAWDGFAVAIEAYATSPGAPQPEGERLRAERAFLFRDLAAVARAEDPVSAALAPGLLTGRALDLPPSWGVAVDVDRDGRDELVIARGPSVIAFDTESWKPVAEARADHPLELVTCGGRDGVGPFVVASAAFVADAPTPGWTVLPLDGGPRHRAAPGDSFTGCALADADGDGHDELYLHTPGGLRQLRRAPDGRWRERELPIGSVVWDVIGGDLDGDGRHELVIAAGEWRAFDVRLVRVSPDGVATVVDRVRLGVVARLAALRSTSRDGARLAALEIDRYPSKTRMPPGKPYGAPPGVYTLRLHGDDLSMVARTELTVPTDPDLWPQWRAAQLDLDGDGRDELLFGFDRNGQHQTAVLRARADGTFDARMVAGLVPVAVPAAGRGGRSLIARLDGETAMWQLGRPGTPAPPHPRPSPQAKAPPAALAGEPTEAEAWQRAERLAMIGQTAPATEALQRLGRVTRSPAVQAAALRRAAELLRAAGLPAGDALEGVATLPSLPADQRLAAWLDAVTDDLDHLALSAAGRRASGLRLASLPVDAAARARLAALEARLPRGRTTVFRGDALHADWEIRDPLAVQVVPGRGLLTVETQVEGEVARLALARTSPTLAVALGGASTRLEWAGDVTVTLAPARDPSAGVTLGIGGRGGDQHYERVLRCASRSQHLGKTESPLPHADASVPLELTIEVEPARGRARCTAVLDGRTWTAELSLPPTDDDAWVLAFGAGPVPRHNLARLEVSRLELDGIDTRPPAAGLAAAALALAHHRTRDVELALAALPAAQRATWAARRIAALAALTDGDDAGAAAELRAALGGPAGERPSRHQLAQLVRARDERFVPVLRDTLGRAAAAVIEAALTQVARHDLDEPRVQGELIRAGLGVSPAGDEAAIRLLGHHGEALLGAGRTEDGRRALEQVMAAARADHGPTTREQTAHSALLLAGEAAVRGDRASARTWVQRALALAPYPEQIADQVLLVPALAPPPDEPGWDDVHRLGRRLDEPAP